ncbi:hypothetical protein LU196_08310 [Pantoea sp. Mb-10]|nr:hypothetical protein [Pantoea sp. Mb-10]
MKHCPQQLNTRLFWHNTLFIFGGFSFLYHVKFALRRRDCVFIFNILYNPKEYTSSAFSFLLTRLSAGTSAHKVKRPPGDPCGRLGDASTLTGKPRAFVKSGVDRHLWHVSAQSKTPAGFPGGRSGDASTLTGKPRAFVKSGVDRHLWHVSE